MLGDVTREVTLSYSHPGRDEIANMTFTYDGSTIVVSM